MESRSEISAEAAPGSGSDAPCDLRAPARSGRKRRGSAVTGDSVNGPKHGQASGGQRAECLSVHQCATTVNLSGESIRRAVHRGELRGYLLGHALRIARTDLMSWVENQQWSKGLCAHRTARPRNRRPKRKAITGGPEAPAAAPSSALSE